MTNKRGEAKRILCIALLLFVAVAFMPTAQTWAASKPAKPKVSVSVTSHSVTLSWKKVKKAKKYQIYRATSKNGKYKKIKTTKKLSYKNTGLTKGKMYFYKVRSVKGKKKSKFTKVAATPMTTPVCKSSSLMSMNKVRTNSILGATGYDVYRSTSKSSGYRYIGSTRNLYFDDKSASIGVTYYYKMRAYKVGSGYKTYSSYSAPGRGTRLLSMPSIKEKKLVENPDDNTKNAIQISWTAVSGAKGYELYRSGDGGVNYTRVYRGSDLTYTDKNVAEGDAKALQDNTTYYYKVRAYHTVFDGIEAYSYASPSKHSREKLINQGKEWLGWDEKNKKHKKIIDIYNAYKPLARDVKGEYEQAWCTTFVTAAAIKSDMVDIMPRERICRYMIDQYKELGLWVENDAYTPKPGDLILYDWEDNGKGDCKGAPNHIGIVVSVNVKEGKITDIEGNNNKRKGHPVSYETVNINGKYIRGFMTPRFDVENGIPFTLERVDVDVNAQEAEEPQDVLTEEPTSIPEEVLEEIQEPDTDILQNPEGEVTVPESGAEEQ